MTVLEERFLEIVPRRLWENKEAVDRLCEEMRLLRESVNRIADVLEGKEGTV